MVERTSITVGTQVEGNYGSLIPNPNGGKRRVQEKAVGTVLSAAGQHKWKVVFDFDGKEKECSSHSLRIVPGDAGIPLDELSNGANRGANRENGGASGGASGG